MHPVCYTCDQIYDHPLHMHTMVKNIFHCQSLAASLIQLITTTPLSLPKVDLSAFSEACQTSMSAQVSFEYHWLASTGKHNAYHHPIHC